MSAGAVARIAEETGPVGKYITDWVIRSGKARLEETGIGKALSQAIENHFDPLYHEIGQSLADSKIAAGIPKDTAYREARNEARTQAADHVFGPKREALTKVIATSLKQHGPIYAQDVHEIVSTHLEDTSNKWLRNRLPGMQSNLSKQGIKETAFKTPTETEVGVKKMMGWMYTPLIAIPHMSQVANIVFENGISATAKGIAELASKSSRDQFLVANRKAGTLFDELRMQAIEDAQGGGIARKLFHYPAFGVVRRAELNLAAVSGKHAALDAVEQLKSGSNVRLAEHQLEKLGIDVNLLKQNNFQLGPEQLQKAMYHASDNAIFQRSGFKTPWLWEQGTAARFVSMYHSFMFRQTAMIKNGLRDGWKYGGMSEVMKQLGILGTLFPVAGFMVKEIEKISTGQNPTKREQGENLELTKNRYMDEYIDSLGHAAGLGIYYTLLKAGQYSSTGTIAGGPVFGTIVDGTYAASSIIHGKWSQAERTVVPKLSYPGRAVHNLFFKKHKGQKNL